MLWVFFTLSLLKLKKFFIFTIKLTKFLYVCLLECSFRAMCLDKNTWMWTDFTTWIKDQCYLKRKFFDTTMTHTDKTTQWSHNLPRRPLFVQTSIVWELYNISWKFVGHIFANAIYSETSTHLFWQDNANRPFRISVLVLPMHFKRSACFVLRCVYRNGG
jgi:hypothetical protein